MLESARHLEMTRARQMRVDTRDLAEAKNWIDIMKRGIKILEIFLWGDRYYVYIIFLALKFQENILKYFSATG